MTRVAYGQIQSEVKEEDWLRSAAPKAGGSGRAQVPWQRRQGVLKGHRLTDGIRSSLGSLEYKRKGCVAPMGSPSATKGCRGAA